MFFLSMLLFACQKEESEGMCKETDVYVTVYQDEDYGGLGQVFGIGEYSTDDLTIVGNDQISSIKVSSDKCVKVTLCQHGALSNLGLCKEYGSDQPILDNLNNEVSYIKVELK